MARYLRLAALLLATAALAACNGSLTVNLTDTPADNATSVVVDFTGMELHNTNGQTVTINFPSAQPIDLMQLQNGLTAALLQSQSVPSGTYDWMQLNVLADKDTQGESYIMLNTGAQYPLYIPSGSATGLKLTTSFSVPQYGSTQLLIEFDLRQSVTGADPDGQSYDLAPALRLENQTEVGTIAANVDLGMLTSQQLGPAAQISQCQGGLFVFTGGSVTPQNGGGASLVDFQPIPYFGTSTESSVSLPNLAPGQLYAGRHLQLRPLRPHRGTRAKRLSEPSLDGAGERLRDRQRDDPSHSPCFGIDLQHGPVTRGRGSREYP